MVLSNSYLEVNALKEMLFYMGSKNTNCMHTTATPIIIIKGNWLYGRVMSCLSCVFVFVSLCVSSLC